MKLSEAIQILEAHSKWRHGDDEIQATQPRLLTEALKQALIVMKEYETLSMVMHQIAEKPRKTKEQRLAKSCVVFLESMR